MSVEYVSWKQGDPTIKADPQTIKPNTWTSISFGSNGTTITPKNDGTALWTVYVNLNSTGGCTDWKVRFIRDPKGSADYTGIASYDPAHEPQTHNHNFNAKKGQPVAAQIWHNGKSDMVIGTREFKMWIP